MCESCGINPLNSRLAESTGDTGVWITDEVGALHALFGTAGVVGRYDVKRLAGVKRNKRLRSSQPPSNGRKCEALGNSNSTRGEGVARIEVAVPVVALKEKTILGNRAAIRGHVVEAVRASVGKLGGEAMPVTNFQDGLEGVVVGVPIGLDLVDDAEIGKLCKVGTAGLLRGGCRCNLRRSKCEGLSW